MTHTIRIHTDILHNHPTFFRGVVIARNVNNRSSCPELEQLLNETIINAREKPIDLQTDPKIIDWNEAHRQFGSNPNKFLPSHRALLKRVQKPNTHLPFINQVVAIMNYNSISSTIPVGGDDVAFTGSELELRYAIGEERFVPLGCPDEVENPDVGEIIYVAGHTGDVMCRRWNWRNSNKTAITESTRTLVMNIDGLGENSEYRAIETRDRVAAMLEKFCNATVETALLSAKCSLHQFKV